MVQLLDTVSSNCAVHYEKGDQVLITITIKVNYDEATVPDKTELIGCLNNKLKYCIDDGMLTPCEAEVVDSYSVEVK